VSGTVAASVDKGGSIAVGARALFERIKMMPEGSITISTDDSATTTIRALGGARRYTLHGIPGEEFPSLPEPDKGIEMVALKTSTLATLIACTHFSISTDETRLHLNSALFEWDGDQVRMVTTDGHRLSKMEAKAGHTGSMAMLIPLKGVMELKRLCDEATSEGLEELQLCKSGPNAFFRLGGVQFGVKLVDAQFPPYDQVIPANSGSTIRAPRASVADALRAVSVAASDRTGGVKLTMDRGVMRFSSESPESGDGFDEVAVDYSGDNFTVGFNAKYFLDVLGAIDDEELLLGISGELDPAVLKPATERDDADYLAVIMPMRI
jgi:DNA polymerase-3 subunit beta